MRTIVQRVDAASVTIEEKVQASIGKGLLVFVGIEDSDTHEDIDWLANKLVNLRIFSDENGLMNVSVKEINGEILVVSQFTLYADTKKGNRPSFIRAARPETAIPVYESFKEKLAAHLGKPVASGVFGAEMKINLINNGPVTIWIDTKNKT